MCHNPDNNLQRFQAFWYPSHQVTRFLKRCCFFVFVFPLQRSATNVWGDFFNCVVEVWVSWARETFGKVVMKVDGNLSRCTLASFNFGLDPSLPFGPWLLGFNVGSPDSTFASCCLLPLHLFLPSSVSSCLLISINFFKTLPEVQLSFMTNSSLILRRLPSLSSLWLALRMSMMEAMHSLFIILVSISRFFVGHMLSIGSLRLQWRLYLFAALLCGLGWGGRLGRRRSRGQVIDMFKLCGQCFYAKHLAPNITSFHPISHIVGGHAGLDAIGRDHEMSFDPSFY